jgi:hypothetical protein
MLKITFSSSNLLADSKNIQDQGHKKTKIFRNFQIFTSKKKENRRTNFFFCVNNAQIIGPQGF